jgi:hypothetical protein
VAQRDELAQPSELRASVVSHVGEVFTVTDYGAEGVEQHFGQWVKHAPDNTRVGQGGKELFEPQIVWQIGVSWAVGDVVALIGLDSIHTFISGYSNFYSGLFTTETPYSVAHFRRIPGRSPYVTIPFTRCPSTSVSR